ncbi:MAG: CopG family transcriptional regulator [Burkholderiaceae bacterium]|nr:CopG family transcriptional regulator [Burkholderiaceae bacterium]
MSTTTIRLDEDLKARVTAAAERAGKTPHAFLLDVIQHGVAQDEQRLALHEEAARRWKKVLRSGETVSWGETRDYLTERAAGKVAARTRPRKSAG